MGIPYTKWGFVSDDFGAILHSRIKNWQYFLNFFCENALLNITHPSNYIYPKFNYLSVLYRPLIFVFYFIQTLFFGINPYGYFLTSSFLHALNAVLVFNIFLYFFNYLWAFSGALFFAFHSSLVVWFGWIDPPEIDTVGEYVATI